MFWSSEASAIVVKSPAKPSRKARRRARSPTAPPVTDESGIHIPSSVTTSHYAIAANGASPCLDFDKDRDRLGDHFDPHRRRRQRSAAAHVAVPQ
jgi:hypothetical protein